MNIDLKKVVEKIQPKGILHVGANTCQELPLYIECGFDVRYWVEPNKDIKQPPEEAVFNYAISDSEGIEALYITSNNSESSSLLPLKFHTEKYPDVSFLNVRFIKTETLDFLLLFCQNTNYLVLDIQGMELRALKGLGKFKKHFDVIITEAYTEDLYSGCGKLHEIKELLSEDYEFIEFAEEAGKGWGDALFIRKDLI